MENTNTTKRYAMCSRLYEGQENPEASFTFDAKDDKAASDKAHNWANYHGFSFYTDSINSSRSDVVVREARNNELNWTPNNEYVA